MNHSELLVEERQGEALLSAPAEGVGKLLYLESYGCQMNFSDSEIVASILREAGYSTTKNIEQANVVLLNTCAIRDNAEQRIRHRLTQLQADKKQNPGLVIGLLGCMAERLKSQLLEEEQVVDLIAGPDAYRTLPQLIDTVEGGQKAANVLLSREETYADVAPVRLDNNGVSAFISIMRGCDNMCSFCVVPFTRGRERSRSAASIVAEAQALVNDGYREVTLLGQNVDSYKWREGDQEVVTFAQLLRQVAAVSPLLRVRFSTSHPKDMGDDVLEAIAEVPNICSYIHLPVQSGSSAVLEKMNRGYSREWYLERIAAIRRIIPDCGISTDVIAGFCGETDDQHAETISLMEEVRFDFAYMFHYSERPKTLAARKYADDVPLETKKARLSQIIDLQMKHSLQSNERCVGKTFEVLIEGDSKRSAAQQAGRNSQNVMCVFNKTHYQKGQYVMVRITSCTAATLVGEIVESQA